MTDTSLTGRSALVTGSTSGLGAGIAAALAAAGAHVVITGRTRSRGEQVVAGIESNGGRATFIPVDFSTGPDAVADLAAAATEAVGGRLDILVNNVATLINPAPTSEVIAEEINAAFGVSVVTPFLLTGLLAPAMAERGDGAVVNIGSIAGLVGASGSALYGATKASVHQLTRAWAAEYGPSGVRVNTVAPGPIATDRSDEYAEAIAPVLAQLPSGRMSSVAEVAAAVVFLAGRTPPTCTARCCPWTAAGPRPEHHPIRIRISTKDHAVSVIRLTMNSTLTAPELMAVLTDFGPSRPNQWPTIDAAHFQVHALGDTWAEVTEGTAAAWERARYDWDAATGRVTVSTHESKVFGPGGGWVFQLTPLTDGTRVDVELSRNPKGVKRKLLASLLSLVAPRALRKSFAAPLHAH